MISSDQQRVAVRGMSRQEENNDMVASVAGTAGRQGCDWANPQVRSDALHHVAVA